MAQQSAASSFIQQQSQNIDSFPPPPIYAEKYSTENVKNGLAPPPPPLPSKFEVFSEHYDLEGPLLPSLNELGCQQLYSGSGNWRAELKKLNRSLVAAFLDLIEILIRCPDHGDRMEKIDPIRNLFINIHHLINEYRPVQARDTVRQMIMHQNQEIINVTEQLNKLSDMGSSTLEALSTELQNFSFGDSIPELPNCWDPIIGTCNDGQSSSQSESDQQEIQPLCPIELPNRIIRKENSITKSHLQKEFAKSQK